MPTRKSPYEAMVLQYLEIGEQEKQLAKRKADIKKELSFAAEDSEPDGSGHLTQYFDNPLEFGGKDVLGFQKQRRVSTTFNEDRAEGLCKDKGLADEQYLSWESYVDQDKISRLYAEDLLTDEEYESLLDQNVTWAFNIVKG